LLSSTGRGADDVVVDCMVVYCVTVGGGVLHILRSAGEAPENREFLVSWLGGVDCKHLESNSGPIAECAMWYGDVGKVTQCQKKNEQ
jgi:hypothetical protein